MGKQVIVVQSGSVGQQANLAFPQQFAAAVSAVYAADIARFQSASKGTHPPAAEKPQPASPSGNNTK
jgi:hypothetical protein